MSRLVLVELTRLRWRRAVQWLLLAAVVLTVVIGAVAAWSTRPPSDEEIRRLDRIVAREADQPYVQQDLRRCEQRPRQYGLEATDPDTVRMACEDLVLPRREWFGGRPELALGREVGQSGFAVSLVLTGIALLVGTTFVGHDWATGSVTNQVLVEPRRLRLWAAKAVAVVLATAVATALLLLAFWSGLAAVAAARDLAVSGSAVDALVAQSWRTVLLAAGAAFGGCAVATLLRSTVATLGVVIVGAVVLPVALVLVLGGEDVLALTPPGNVVAVLVDGWTTYDDRGRPQVRSAGAGGLYLLLLLAAAALASAVSFRRGDVG